ncbi:hypothetical protein AWW67_03155 [Roseivirga seohaensis]|uniref:Lipoprotein n=1 Tax=Roseivirga seohaensis TaxID=1914963 RepID=A0A150XZP2_9BACT|nr:hypothetical protein [Roseivirga seohaensis]KYG84124.1 hypothetical protein AWW67_03155 [Roseivirga seohaensis]
MKLRSQAFSIFSFLLLVLLTVSCGTSKEVTDDNVKSYITQVVDSVMVDRLSTLQLLDYNVDTKEFLVGDQQTNEVLIVNENGDLVLQFNPHVESPAYVGDYDFGWSFYGNDGLVCHSHYYLYQFDKKGNKLAKIPYPVEARSIWWLDRDPTMVDSYTINGSTEVLAFITEPAGPPYNSQGFQDSTVMLYRMNFETGEATPVMEKQPESVYRTLGKFVDRGFPYVTKMKNDRFAQVYSIDSMLYIFDVANNNLVNAIPLPKAFQPEYETIEFGEKGEPDIFRINSYVVSTGDNIMVSVMGKVPESIIREIYKKVDMLSESQDYKDAVKKYMTNNHLLFDENRFLGEVKWTAGNVGYQKISSPDGYFWVQRRYDDERDYQTFLKVKIVEDSNSEKP